MAIYLRCSEQPLRSCQRTTPTLLKRGSRSARVTSQFNRWDGRACGACAKDQAVHGRLFASALIQSLPSFRISSTSGLRYGKMILVLFQPLVIVLFDFRCPLGIDLSGGVLLLSQTLVPERVLKMSAFRVLHHLLRELRRYKDHTAIPPQHHISGHHHGMPNARGPVDAHHG